MKKYDAIIIGSGQAGVPLARRLAEAGWSVAVIERLYTGGTCINYGCTPTKAMVASAKSAYQARRASDYGVIVNDVSINMPALIDRKNKIIERFRNGSERSLKAFSNIDLIYGEASFVDKKQIEIKGNDGTNQQLEADYIFINTGGRTSIPDIEGLDQVNYLTSTSILDVEDVPEHLLIVGASYIALEFGQMFRRYGSKITILETSNIFLKKEDRDVADEMQKIFKEEDIDIFTNTTIKSLKNLSGKAIEAIVTINGKEQQINASHLLLAAGRVPNTDVLNLKVAGIETNERGYIKVNDKLETNVNGIYALGDVTGGPAFTHISYNDYLVVCKNILHHADASTKGRFVPYCMFTDPELGRVGITEDEAKEQGLNYKVAKIPMARVARGIETGETKGFMKAIVDADSKQLLGVAILGAQGGELMSLLQIAMMGNITYEQLRENIFAHPTYSESINNLFMSLDEK
jgi:dihydrolipoamide dehydrogenase